MLEAAGILRFGGCAWDADEGYAVVFVIVGDESDGPVGVGDGAAEEGGVEVGHALQVGGAQDDVGEDGRREHFVAGLVEVEHGFFFGSCLVGIGLVFQFGIVFWGDVITGIDW